MGFNVLSLFDGISCGQIALQRAGIKVDKYYASEIDKSAIKVTQANYPNTIQVGDVSKLDSKDFSDISLVCGGSPCQPFSFSGKQLAFADPRAKLFFEYVRILKEVKPKYFFLENVRMKQEYQDIITEHMGVEPICINSRLVSSQNRVRYYWTNIPNVTQPEDKNITWQDIKEDGIEIESHPRDQECVAAMRGRYLVDGKRQDGKQLTKGLTQQYIEFRHDGKTNTITTVSKDNVVVPFKLEKRVLASEFDYRFMTPLEHERLQTVDDGYTDHVGATKRCKLLGNAWTVDVISHVFKGMK